MWMGSFLHKQQELTSSWSPLSHTQHTETHVGQREPRGSHVQPSYPKVGSPRESWHTHWQTTSDLG